MNDPFAAYTTTQTPSAFQWVRQPPKFTLPLGISTSSNTWFLEPTAKWRTGNITANVQLII